MREASVLAAIREHYEQMFQAERKVADFILAAPDKAVLMNVSELANESGVSDATVVRMCKHIGYQGYYQMKIHLSHELGRTMLRERQSEGPPGTPKDVLDRLALCLTDMAEHTDTDTLLRVANLIHECPMVNVIAAGNTAPVAVDLGFRLGRYGIRTTYSMVAEYFMNYVNHAKPDELLIAISKSGASRQVLQAVELAKQKGIRVVAVTQHNFSPLSQLADYLLLTSTAHDIFDNDYGPASHFAEMAMNDLLLYFVLHTDRLRKQAVRNLEIDDVEYILSEYKV